jgi:hypothetical protein
VPKQRNKVGSFPVIEPNAAGIDIVATQIAIRTWSIIDTKPKEKHSSDVLGDGLFDGSLCYSNVL